MNITLAEIRNAGEALNKVLEFPIDAKLAYRIRKICSKLMEDLKLTEETRLKLVNEKYGVRDEVSKQTRVPPDKLEAFMKEFDDFLKTEVELPVQKIPFECLTGLKISAADMVLIEKFIEEPIEEKDGPK